MKLKNDEKIEEELACHSKTDVSNLKSSNSITQKS